MVRRVLWPLIVCGCCDPVGWGDPGASALRHDAVNWRLLVFKQFTIDSTSGTNSLQSRITSPVQRSCASELCAITRLPPSTRKIPNTDPAAAAIRNRGRQGRVQYCTVRLRDRDIRTRTSCWATGCIKFDIATVPTVSRETKLAQKLAAIRC